MKKLKHNLIKIIFISLAMVLLPCGFANATDYIVPTSMNFVTPSTFPGIGPGDCLFMEAGERTGITFKGFRGESGNPIIITNQGGLVDINTSSYNWAVSFRDCQHIKFSGKGDSNYKYGIKISEANVGAVTAYRKTEYIEIENIEVTKTGIGISAKTRDDEDGNLVTRDEWVQHDTTVHDCYIHDIDGEGLYLGSSYWQDGIEPELDGVYVYNNIIDSPGYECFQVGSAPNNVEVHHNICTNAGWSNEGDPPTGANGQTGMMVNRGTTGKWYNNKIINPGRHGIYIQGVGGYDFFNNIIVNTGSNVGVGQGIIWRGSGPGNFYNNNIINSVGDGIYVDSYINDGLIYDNIIAGYGDVAIRNNNSNKYNNIETNDISSVGFVDSNNNNFHLQATSIAIDNGSNSGYSDFDFDGIIRPQGTASDIGAYEYGEVSCTENWDCTDWSEWSACVDNVQTHTCICTDMNSCRTTINKPSEIETRVCESSATYGISNFIQLVGDWLKTETGLTSDVNNDRVVNTRDLGIMMSNWNQ